MNPYHFNDVVNLTNSITGSLQNTKSVLLTQSFDSHDGCQEFRRIPLSGFGSYLARARNNCRQRRRLVLPADSIEAGRVKVQGEAMPFDGKSKVRFDHDPGARGAGISDI